MLAGKAVMINWSDVAPEHRPAYYEWHSREHMVGRVAIPGYQRGRRYLAVRAQRDFLVLYEVDDLAVVTGPDYLAKANQPSPLTLAHHAVRQEQRPRTRERASIVRHRHGWLRTDAALRSARRRRGAHWPLPGRGRIAARRRTGRYRRGPSARCRQGGEQHGAGGTAGTSHAHPQLDRRPRRRLARGGRRRLRRAAGYHSAAPATAARTDRAGTPTACSWSPCARRGAYRDTLEGGQRTEDQGSHLRGGPFRATCTATCWRSSPGKATADGSLYDGTPMSPGFTRIIEPATIISVMLVLEDGQIAFGDCADVILAGVAGRDPAFNAQGPHRLRAQRRRRCAARPDVSKFKANAEEMDAYRARRQAASHRDPLRREPGAAARHRARAQADDGRGDRARIRQHDLDRADSDPRVVPQGRSRAARPRDPEARRAAAARIVPDRERARRPAGREARGVRAARRDALQGNRRRGL